MVKKKMNKAPLPENFDGEAFQRLFNLTEFDFFVDKGELFYPANLKNVDLSACLIDPVENARREAYLNKGCTIDDLVVALWELIVEGRPERSQELQEKRIEVKKEISK